MPADTSWTYGGANVASSTCDVLMRTHDTRAPYHATQEVGVAMTTATRAQVSREELLHRAAGLVPALAERAEHTEQLRQIPDDTLSDLQRTGLLRAANPERFNGYGVDYDVALAIGAELGRGCGSTAWCYTVWSSHQWLAGMYPEQAQEEYFGTSTNVLSSSSF